MKLSKVSKIGFYLVYGILFALLNFLVFVIFKPWNIQVDKCVIGFWLSYSFLIVAFGLQFLTLLIFERKNGIHAIFMGIPLFMVGLIYFIIEAFLALIFIILAVFEVQVPLTLEVVLQVLALAIFLICAILAIMGRNVLNEIEDSRKKAVTNIRYLVADMEMAALSLSNNQELKKEVLNVSEDIKYSDPMSNKNVAMLDEKINDLVMQLKDACQVSNPDSELIKELLRKIKLSVRERNQKISIDK